MNNDDALDALIAKAKRHDAPPEHAEQDAWAGFVGALGGGGGGGGEGTGSAPPPIAEALTGGASSVGLVKGIAALAVAGAVGWGVSARNQPDPSPRLEAPIETSAPLKHPASAADPAPLPAVAPVPTVLPEPRSRTADPEAADAQRRSAPPRPTPPTVPSSPSTLAEEARLVGSMWKAIDRGNAKAALPLAAQHRTRFPEGELRLEAQAARVAARCILGRAINLTELQALRRAASTSVANRLTAACGEGD